MIWCGIDPGLHTGLAVWDGGKRELRLVATLPLWKALDTVKKWKAVAAGIPTRFAVVFEDARKRKWLPQERNVSEYRGKLMGAGSVKRDCVIWQEFLEDNGIPFFQLAPAKGLTKWNKDTFAKVTGYKGRTSNHARDAAMLVFGR